jgi:chromosome segregation ATPase
MAGETRGKKRRIVLWGIAALLAIVSLVLIYFNYQALENAIGVAEKNAQAQASNFMLVKHSLDEANQKIEELTKELVLVNAELSTARAEVASLQQLNDDLRGTVGLLERFKTKSETLEGMVAELNQKNQDLDLELQMMRKKLAEFQPDITDVDEGRAKIRRFKEKIHQVKQNIATLRRQVVKDHLAALKENDRLELLYGNQGYMVKDGENLSVAKPQQKGVDINVRIVNP